MLTRQGSDVLNVGCVVSLLGAILLPRKCPLQCKAHTRPHAIFRNLHLPKVASAPF
jgi:hypothetical protein